MNAVRRALEERAASAGRAHEGNAQAVLLIAYTGCPTVGEQVRMKGKLWYRKQLCGRFNAFLLEQLASIPSRIPVILLNRYAAYMYGTERPGSREDAHPLVYFADQAADSPGDIRNAFRRHFGEMVCTIADHHPVYLVAPIPEMPVDVPRAVARAILHGRAPHVFTTVPGYHERQQTVLRMLQQAARSCGARILDPVPYLCSAGQCRGHEGNKPLYIDTNHLSERGSARLTALFRAALAPTVGDATKSGPDLGSRPSDDGQAAAGEHEKLP